MSARTSLDSDARVSCMHSSTPVTFRRGLIRLLTRSTVWSSLPKPCRRQEVRLQRDQDLLGGRQRVERQQPERRGAVDQAEIELVLAAPAWPRAG